MKYIPIALLALWLLLSATGARADDSPNVLIASRPDGCARITVANDLTPWRFATLDRYRDDAQTRAPIVYFEDGVALACFGEPFAAGDYLQARAYRYDATSTAVSIGGAWEPYVPPALVYLPAVTR